MSYFIKKTQKSWSTINNVKFGNVLMYQINFLMHDREKVEKVAFITILV